MGDVKSAIAAGKAVLGIGLVPQELKQFWWTKTENRLHLEHMTGENRLEKGVWTYTLDDIWTGSGLLQEDGRRCHGTVRGESDKRLC